MNPYCDIPDWLQDETVDTKFHDPTVFSDWFAFWAAQFLEVVHAQ